MDIYDYDYHHDDMFQTTHPDIQVILQKVPLGSPYPISIKVSFMHHLPVMDEIGPGNTTWGKQWGKHAENMGRYGKI